MTKSKRTKAVAIDVVSHGRVIARIIVGDDTHQAARKRLLAARKHCRVGDVLSPTHTMWDAAR